MKRQSESDTGDYPFSTLLAADPDGADAGGYSILLAGLRHRVHLRRATPLPGLYPRQLRRLRLAWCRDFTHHGWDLHPYLRTPPGERTPGRGFAPADVLCPSAHEALFGKSFPRPDAPAADADLVYRRLDARDPGCRHEEPLLLSLRAGARLLGSELQVGVPDGAGQGDPLGFRMAWADLWLFPDSHALHPLCNAVLACKLVPTRVTDRAGATRPYRVGDLAVLNRLLRDLDPSELGGAWLKAPGGGAPEHFWAAVLRHWLGVGLAADGRLAAAAGPGNVLRLKPGDEVWADRRSPYVKVLTAARIAPPPADGCFSCPRVEPPLAPDRMAREQAAGLWSAEQSACLQAHAQGYPGLGEALLYELASTADEGSALGLAGDAAWQVNLEYLRQRLSQSGVAIWEHWRGLALRDTCAFLAWHPGMPILGQAQGRYYPLYLYTYYCQLRLHDLAEGIIEHELTDLQHAREVRHAFMQFRNQLWFREAAVGFQGIAVADALRAGMGLDGLYASVATDIEEVGNYVDQRANAGRQQAIALLVALIYPAGLLWDLKKDLVLPSLKTWDTWWLAAGTGVLAFLVIALYLVLGPRISRWLGRLADWVRRRGW